MTQRVAWQRWGEYLLAILAGNFLYFLLEPHLPIALRHRRFAIDAGLALDFLFCLGCYGLLRPVSFLRSEGTK